MKNILLGLCLLLFYPLTAQNQSTEALLEAVKFNDLAKVKQYVLSEEEANWQDEHQASLLMLASYYADLEMVKFLLEKGANPQKKGVIWLDQAQQSYYGSPLAIAAGEKSSMLSNVMSTLRLPSPVSV